MRERLGIRGQEPLAGSGLGSPRIVVRQQKGVHKRSPLFRRALIACTFTCPRRSSYLLCFTLCRADPTPRVDRQLMHRKKNAGVALPYIIHLRCNFYTGNTGQPKGSIDQLAKFRLPGRPATGGARKTTWREHAKECALHRRRRASRSDSSRVSTSPSRTGPLTLRMIWRSWSCRNLTRTWVTCRDGRGGARREAVDHRVPRYQRARLPSSQSAQVPPATPPHAPDHGFRCGRAPSPQWRA